MNNNNNNNVYLLNYYSIFLFLQDFRKTDADIFYVILCKFLPFLYFTMIDAIAFSGRNL